MHGKRLPALLMALALVFALAACAAASLCC